MPYINHGCAIDLNNNLKSPQTPGELNYLMTQLAIHYVEDHGLSYTTINDIMGVFSCAQAEFYRRVAVPYETNKIIENGDVYPSQMTK